MRFEFKVSVAFVVVGIALLVVYGLTTTTFGTFNEEPFWFCYPLGLAMFMVGIIISIFTDWEAAK